MKYLEGTKTIWGRELIQSQAVLRVLGIGLFALLTVLGAFVRIPLPFTPVPITLQTFFILLSGLYLKKYDGSLSQILYLVLGIIGLPVFAGAKGGVAVILGPTGGYLIGFVLAPLIVNSLAHSRIVANGFLRITLAMICGALVYYALGTINLSLYLRINLLQAFVLGCLPFLPGAAIKIMVGAKIFTSHRKLEKKFNRFI